MLYATTAAVGAAGAVAAAWPLLDQMNPDAHGRAGGAIVAVDLNDLQPAEQRRAAWHNFPVFVVRRTQAMLTAMQDANFVAQLVDPQSHTMQQPAYARNWHRSLDPVFAVLVGVCTHCRCVPNYFAVASALNAAGGYVCPCCASHYDPAGRAYSGVARYNLPVPPHEIFGRSKIVLGRNPPGELFSFESIQQI